MSADPSAAPMPGAPPVPCHGLELGSLDNSRYQGIRHIRTTSVCQLVATFSVCDAGPSHSDSSGTCMPFVPQSGITGPSSVHQLASARRMQISSANPSATLARTLDPFHLVLQRPHFPPRLKGAGISLTCYILQGSSTVLSPPLGHQRPDSPSQWSFYRYSTRCSVGLTPANPLSKGMAPGLVPRRMTKSAVLGNYHVF